MLTLPRGAHLWLPGYVRHAVRRRPPVAGVIDILFCVADHYEPGRKQPGLDVERARVRAWLDRYPRIAGQFRDADGRPPRHTFFYPIEEYRREHLDGLAALCGQGFGEVEIHLHHDCDTSENLTASLRDFVHCLAAGHGLLARRRDGEATYAFIHGNWALDNSRPDGRWCGVNDEITVLLNTGCYADMTMPAAPELAQTRTVNSIYYAVDDPARPKSHDIGTPAKVGRASSAEELLLVQGPLALDWINRKAGVVPRLDAASIDASNPPTLDRFRRRVRTGISVSGRPEWIFIKAHTHGAAEPNAAVLLGPAMERFHRDITTHFNDGRSYRLHYVTAREMVNVIRAAEAGERGNAGAFRDYDLQVGSVTGSRLRALEPQHT